MKGKIFNAQEVQAIIDGKKTMFREVIKPYPVLSDDKSYWEFKSVQWAGENSSYAKNFGDNARPEMPDLCPYQVGQNIFVKESFWVNKKHGKFCYYDQDIFECGDSIIKKPAKHMKQEHSRLFLRITKIKVERLLDISEEDCLKSGVKCLAGEEIADTGDYFESEYYFGELKEKIKECGCIYGCACNVYDPTSDFVNTYDNPFDPFMEFWDSNHKKPEHKWDADPWVFVYEFEVLDLKK